MADRKTEIDPDAAREALDTVQQAENAGLSRVIPPRWFGLAIALISGSIVASAAAGLSEMTAVSVAAIAVAIAIRQRRSAARTKALPGNARGIVALIGLTVFAISLIAGGRVLVQAYALSWAPLVSGGVVAIGVYYLSRKERRAYSDLTGRAQGE